MVGGGIDRDITGPTTLNLTVPDTTPGFVTFVDAEGHPIPGTMWLQGSTLAANVPIGDGLSGRGWIGTDTIGPDDHGAYRVPLFRPVPTSADISTTTAPVRRGATAARWACCGSAPGEHLVIAKRPAWHRPIPVPRTTVTTYGTTLMPSWIQPEEDGGGTLACLVTIADPAGDSRQLTTPWTIASFSGLRPNTPYTVAVTAVNTHGTGPAVAVSALTGDAPPTTRGTPHRRTLDQPVGNGDRARPRPPAAGATGRCRLTARSTTSAPPLNSATARPAPSTSNRPRPARATGPSTATAPSPTSGTPRRSGMSTWRSWPKTSIRLSLSATPSGKGYWVFTNKGRVLAFGDAAVLGDMSQTKLNGPVLGSVATPTGRGYYMVASDGGIFAFGDAAFAGSMGGKKLNAPVQSLVPDSDGKGYWLVASDGGIFAFDAPFRGLHGRHQAQQASGRDGPLRRRIPHGRRRRRHLQLLHLAVRRVARRQATGGASRGRGGVANSG